MEHLTLVELNNIIKNVLSSGLEPSYWVVAEIGEMRLNQKGHCYLELVQKEDNSILSKTKATIWSYTFRNINGWFEAINHKPLQAGINVLANVQVNYHEVYGFSLNIKDIDANYTLGERARKRQQVIDQLHNDGVFELNKLNTLPVVPQNIAVISAPNAAGYEDFMNQLMHNSYGYAIHTELFSTIMQGEAATQEIINALHAIFENADQFDAVAIIRGGGSQLDLDCFDDYELAAHVAQFPLPIITGIGHERDESIVDMVAHTKMKTPTAVAEFLLKGFEAFEESILEKLNIIQKSAQGLLHSAQQNLNTLSMSAKASAVLKITNQKNSLQATKQRLQWIAEKKLLSAKHGLENINNSISSLDPKSVFDRGFTYSHVNGVPLSKLRLKPQDVLTTVTKSNKIKSIITEIET